MTNEKLPITVVIVTRNEEDNLPTCLDALTRFNQIIVFDSNSTDKTAKIAKTRNATVINFTWNKQYPKKRQYFIDNYADIIGNDWVFWVDADEEITDELTNEIDRIFRTQDLSQICGFWISGQYSWQKKRLNFGLRNKKIALFKYQDMKFPEVNDLNIPGMGEIEGHYQPVRKDPTSNLTISSLLHPLIHHAFNHKDKWLQRHKHYAKWEDAMHKQAAWPQEDSKIRNTLKSIFKNSPPAIKCTSMFIYSYVLKLGCLDGIAGFEFAAIRAKYYLR